MCGVKVGVGWRLMSQKGWILSFVCSASVVVSVVLVICGVVLIVAPPLASPLPTPTPTALPFSSTTTISLRLRLRKKYKPKIYAGLLANPQPVCVFLLLPVTHLMTLTAATRTAWCAQQCSCYTVHYTTLPFPHPF